MQEQWLIIGISGVTCSGKTTLAHSLYQKFKEKRGCELQSGVELNRVELLCQDVYFRDVADPNHEKVEKLNHLNWEIIESIDMTKMINDAMSILGNNFVLYNTRSGAESFKNPKNLFNKNYAGNHKPRRYDPDMMRKSDDHSKFMKIVKQNKSLNVLIIEGFLIFNHAVLLDLCNVKFHLHIPYEICYARRVKRTYDPPDVPCKYQKIFKVKRDCGEEDDLMMF